MPKVRRYSLLICIRIALRRGDLLYLSRGYTDLIIPIVDKTTVFKVPFRFAFKDDEFKNDAGIYDFANDGLPKFSILTKTTTILFAKIHNEKNRRSVILHDND